MSNSYSSACATCLVLKPVFIFWVCHVLWWLKLSGGYVLQRHMFCFFSLQQHVFFFFSPKLFYLSISLFAVHTGTWRILKYKKKSEVEIFFIVLCISFARFLEVFYSLWWCWFHGHLLVPASLRFWYSSLSLSLTSGVVVVFHLGWDKGWFFGSGVLFFYYPLIFPLCESWNFVHGYVWTLGNFSVW